MVLGATTTGQLLWAGAGLILAVGVGALVVLVAAVVFRWYVALSQSSQDEPTFAAMLVTAAGSATAGVVLSTQRLDLDWWWHASIGVGVLVVVGFGAFASGVTSAAAVNDHDNEINLGFLTGAWSALSGAGLAFLLIVGRDVAIWWAALLGVGLAVVLGPVLAVVLAGREGERRTYNRVYSRA